MMQVAEEREGEVNSTTSSTCYSANTYQIHGFKHSMRSLISLVTFCCQYRLIILMEIDSRGLKEIYVAYMRNRGKRRNEREKHAVSTLLTHALEVSCSFRSIYFPC